MILGTLAHVALSIPLFGVALLIGWAGNVWAAALSVSLYWLGRELAQSMRPGNPLAIQWNLTNTLNFGVPCLAAILAACVIEFTR
jgi:hypothetical protein